jgi:predicted Zn-dependent peptidase
MHIEDLFEECLYGDQPAGWDTIGAKENVLRFKRKDFTEYLQSQYGAQNIIVCVAGNIGVKSEELRVKNLVNKYFSKLKKSDSVKKQPVIEKQTAPKIKILYKKTDQAHLSLGVRAFPLGHKDEFVLRVLSVILGGSMSSRLFSELRERRGLAYYVNTTSELYTDSGYLTTQAGVPVDRLPQAVKIILKEYGKLKRELVGEKELRKVKDLIRGRSVIQLEASDSMAGWYGRQAVLRGDVFPPEHYFKKIYKVTAGDIRRVAREIFADKGLNLAVIGPYKKLDLRLKI